MMRDDGKLAIRIDRFTSLAGVNEAVARVRDRKLNAILSPGDGGAGRKLSDDLRYFTAINYAIPTSVAFIRLDAFAALPEPVQAQLMAAAAETEKSQFDLIDRRTAEYYVRMRANGANTQILPSRPSSPPQTGRRDANRDLGQSTSRGCCNI